MFNYIISIELMVKLQNCYEVTTISCEKWPQPYYMHYDDRSNSLYFTDYLARTINRFDFHKNRTYTATIENNIVTSFIIPVEGSRNRFIVCGGTTVTLIKWNGKDCKAKVIKDLFTIKTALDGPQWDYGKIAPNCEFYGGSTHLSMCSTLSGRREAALYRNTKPIIKNILVSGAFDWDERRKMFYHVDICNRLVRGFRWNPKTGHIGLYATCYYAYFEILKTKKTEKKSFLCRS